MLRELGSAVVEIDLCPFVETGGLLYGGPWVAERLAEFEDLLARDPSAVHPVTREVLTGGARLAQLMPFGPSMGSPSSSANARDLGSRRRALLADHPDALQRCRVGV